MAPWLTGLAIKKSQRSLPHMMTNRGIHTDDTDGLSVHTLIKGWRLAFLVQRWADASGVQRTVC